MAAIGRTAAGGVTRLTLSDEDRAGRDLFGALCAEAGLVLRVDRAGNMFARLEGTRSDLPPILVGSHLDSQPLGGRYDGSYGVLAALEAVRTVRDVGLRTRHPVEVVNWTNEEGTRFRPAPTGSAVFAGRVGLDEALASRDEEGLAFGVELRRIGYAGEAAVGTRVAGFLEIHIEQGPVLERAGLPIGIVLGNFGVAAYEVVLRGAGAHIGTTPSDVRRDALLGAAQVIVGVRELARANEPGGRATVARLTVAPNVRAVVASEVAFTLDCRHHDPAKLDLMAAQAERLVRDAAAANGLEASMQRAWSFAPVPYDPRWLAAIRGAAETHGYPAMELYSGAAHDAV
jgi:N-carbamoyl-L-amino-acid hydrolase